jgi:rhodanese-related sulfurtransferase
LPPRDRFESIEGEDLYRRMALGQAVAIVDVRTETEYRKRHIPGSTLIPLHEIESRLNELPRGETPLAIVCEHGIRSVSACRLLAEHGFGPLYNLLGGLGEWPGPLRTGSGRNGQQPLGVGPSSFLVESFDLLPRGLALDLAMGEGRNAIYLATRGFDVDGVDASPRRVAIARAAARRLGAPIRANVGNVEDGTYIIPLETYDVILVFNYLHRPLFKDIRDGVLPGGVVVYQTFTAEQARHGRPQNPAHLLEPGELQATFADWEVLRYRELVGLARDGGRTRAIASIVARKPRGD